MGVATSEDQIDKPASGLGRLMDLVAKDMADVNKIILEKTCSHIDMIPALAGYLVNAGGKRLRSMLTLVSAQMCGHTSRDHIILATVIEFMHTATLLHDDVMDGSDMRRGKETARLLWGNNASILVGDHLLGQAFKMMVEVGSMEALSVISNTAVIITEGEVWQLSMAHNITSTEDDYLNIINAKTASLFAAATEVGAIISNTDQQKRAALHSFGNNLGIAFQLVDDVLDYTGNSSKFGKSVGDDFREGKVTLPFILSYNRSSKTERAFWSRVLQDGKIDDGDLGHAISLMHKYGTIDDTMQRARYYGQLAQNSLEIFPDSEHKDALLDVIAFCVDRQY